MPKDPNDKNLNTSVSAIKDAKVCMRMWWFTKVCKLPVEQQAVTIFGDIGHACCDRYLSADDRGLDKKGQPVNLFPENWMTMVNRFDKTETPYTVSPTEASLIVTLIHKAITEGVLVRTPGREIERDFEFEIFNKGYVKAILRGFIDVNTPRGLEDHKFVKSLAYNGMSHLKKDVQLFGYALERYIDGHQGTLWLTWNLFIKDFDKPKVVKREIEVTKEQVLAFYQETILPLVKQMLDYHIKYPKTLIHKWRDIKPANNPNQTCNHHYGRQCPFIGICSGVHTIDQYLLKFGTTVNQLVGNIENNISKGSTMTTNSLIAKVQAENAAVNAGNPGVVAVAPAATIPLMPAAAVAGAVAVPAPAAPAPAPVAGGLLDAVTQITGAPAVEAVPVPTAPVQVPVAPVAVAPVIGVDVGVATGDVTVVSDGRQMAPWYQEFNGQPCPACKDNTVLGYNSKMGVCRACDARAMALELPGAHDYKVDVLEGGMLQFTLIGTAETTAVQVAPTPVVKTEIVPVPAPVAVPVAPLAQPALTPTMDALADAAGRIAASVAEAPAVPQSISGEGFDLLIGCTYVKDNYGKDSVVDADTLVKDMLEGAAAGAGVHASQIEHFALMQVVDGVIPAIVATLAGKSVVSLIPSKGSAHARMIDGLRQYATTIIYPFAV